MALFYRNSPPEERYKKNRPHHLKKTRMMLGDRLKVRWLRTTILPYFFGCERKECFLGTGFFQLLFPKSFLGLATFCRFGLKMD